jgi:hypothetical protein
VDELDRTLSTDAELGPMLPSLVDAGYITIDGESTTAHFWRFTPKGAHRAEALGLD